MMKPSEFFKLLDQKALDTTSNHLDKQYHTKSEPNFQDPQESLTGDKLLELAQAKKAKEAIEVSISKITDDLNELSKSLEQSQPYLQNEKANNDVRKLVSNLETKINEVKCRLNIDNNTSNTPIRTF